MGDPGRRQHPFVGGVSCVVDVVTRAWPIRRRGPLGTTGYGAQPTPSATTAFSRLPPFIGSILRAAKGRLDPFAAPFCYDRYLRQAALRGRPAEGVKSPQSGGCGNQFVESRWPYLDGLVLLDGHVVGAGLGIRWRRAVVGARGRRATAIRAFATSEFERQALDLDH